MTTVRSFLLLLLLLLQATTPLNEEHPATTIIFLVQFGSYPSSPFGNQVSSRDQADRLLGMETIVFVNIIITNGLIFLGGTNDAR